ncbi:MAG: response regulator [Moraxellaceae bacterium]|nr:MAG: response regulator [Moraxellaceae bacterium]
MSKRILIVDDNEDFAHGFAAILSHMGHQTCVAYDGENAIARAAVFAPDVVTLDFDMPGLNGEEVAEKLRGLKVGRALLLICVTGGSLDRLVKAQFDYFLQKPVDYNALGKILSLPQ